MLNEDWSIVEKYSQCLRIDPNSKYLVLKVAMLLKGLQPSDNKESIDINNFVLIKLSATDHQL
jgi:hypothetical protein